MPTPLQDQLFHELQDATLFDQTHQAATHYREAAMDRHIFPTASALEQLVQFEEDLPSGMSSASDVLTMLEEIGGPATVAQLGGRYFGFVNGSALPVGIAAKMLSTSWDQNAAMEVISPIVAKLEQVVERWLVQLFGLPAATCAGFVSGTSMANFCALAAARYRLLERQGWDVTERGLFGAPPLRVVTCRQAHSTILKATSLVGIGKGQIEWVDVDEQGRILVDEIPELDERTILVLQAGNVNSGAFEDFSSIMGKAREQGAWVHVDGAFGLWAGATTRLRHLTAGMEQANSWAVDGHKTLNTPYDSGIVMCADREALVSALHMTGSYIVRSAGRDGMYYTPEMSRRARVIELWATLKFLGQEGIDEMIWTMHECAQQFAGLLRDLPGITVWNEVVFNQVIFSCETDEKTQRLMEHIQDDRTCWMGPSQWRGRQVIRISVCSWATTEADVRRSGGVIADYIESLE